MVETFGTGKIPDDDLAQLVEQHFDFRLAGILKALSAPAVAVPP